MTADATTSGSGTGSAGLCARPDAQRSGSRRAWPARLGLPLALFIAATVLFGLDLGRLGDDNGGYMRDPATGRITSLFPEAKHYLHKPFSKTGVFWRPFFAPYFTTVTNLAWDHPWAQNLFDALVHLGVAGLIFVLLRALHIGRAAASIATVLFLVYPAPMQVVFWKASSGTSIAAGLLLLAYLAAISWARHPRRWWSVIALAALGFAVPAFNEQPAPALAVVPLFFLAGMPRGASWRAALPRLLAATAACGLTCGLYVLMMSISGPKIYELVKPGQVGARLERMMPDLLGALSMREFLTPALRAGLAKLGEELPRSVLGFAVVAATAWPWLARLRRDSSLEAGGPPRRGLVAGALLIGLLLSLLAILMVSIYTFWESRYLYAPAVMLALLLGVALDRAIRAWARLPERPRAVARPLWRAGLLAALAVGVVAAIGSQEPYRRRANADARQAASLRAQVPDPPPGAFFMPVAVHDEKPPVEGWRWSVPLAYSWWLYPWSVRHALPCLYGRTDVFSGYAAPVGGPQVLGADAAGLRYRQIMPQSLGFAADPAGGFLVPWPQVIPFVIEADGSVGIVTRLRLPDGREQDLPALRGAVDSGRVAERTEALRM